MPNDVTGMARETWFNLWSKENWPFQELQHGDEVFWYESPRARLRWRTIVMSLDRFRYATKQEVIERLGLSDAEAQQKYLVAAPDAGYCLAYRVQPQELLDIPKPPAFRFPQLGWARVDAEFFAAWGITAKGRTVLSPVDEVYPDELPMEGFAEGARLRVQVNRYDRDPAARAACIGARGYMCLACGLDMGSMYGEIGHGFIHVHYLVPLSVAAGLTQVDPRTDLVPLCPNCHAMIHRAVPPSAGEAVTVRPLGRSVVTLTP